MLFIARKKLGRVSRSSRCGHGASRKDYDADVDYRTERATKNKNLFFFYIGCGTKP